MKANKIKSILFVIALTGMILIFISACKTSITNEVYDPQINPADFITGVDNEYFFLIPGRTLIYEAKTDEGTERIEVTTLNDTRVVMGIECMIVWDRVFLNDELVEDTMDWFAQDMDGNVWYFGEDSKEIRDGEVISHAGSWESGIDNAKPGIIMLVNPEIGDQYRQEYLIGQAEDMGEVLAMDEKVEVPYGVFESCLKTRDWTPLEKNSDEYKYYSPDTGAVVLEVGVYSGERVELVDIKNE
ncbi:MAG TPA: hypothetical protein VIH07_02945 [Candidatus Humimicrobiaceae bacterium]